MRGVWDQFSDCCLLKNGSLSWIHLSFTFTYNFLFNNWGIKYWIHIQVLIFEAVQGCIKLIIDYPLITYISVTEKYIYVGQATMIYFRRLSEVLKKMRWEIYNRQEQKRKCLWKFLSIYDSRVLLLDFSRFFRALPTFRKTQTDIKRTKTFISRVEFEPTIPEFELAKTMP
jgi:hypothetical protein